MQRKLTTVLAVFAMFAVCVPPATAKPGNGPQGEPNHGSSAAAKLCAEHKKADKAAFKALWGKHAMRDCIRAGRGEDEVATAPVEEIVNAARECRTEREADPAAFATTYGTNHNDRNAFGKCVSTKVRADDDTETPVTESA